MLIIYGKYEEKLFLELKDTITLQIERNMTIIFAFGFIFIWKIKEAFHSTGKFE